MPPAADDGSPEFAVALAGPLANALLGGVALGSETQGVDLLLIGAENPLHVDILFDDGIKSSNTDFRDNQPITSGG